MHNIITVETKSWLDEYPQFAYDYFVRKTSLQMVDSWLLFHSAPQDMIQESSRFTNNSPGAATPVRKTSVQELESETGLSRSILISKGISIFLTMPLSCDVIPLCNFTSDYAARKILQKIRFQNYNREILLKLIKDIHNNLDRRNLCHKIFQDIRILTDADRCSLFLIKGQKGDPSRCPVNQLFDVSCHSTVEQMQRTEEIRIPWGNGIVGHVVEYRKYLNISDCYKDDRFNSQVDGKTGYKIHNMLCMPVLQADGEVKAVAQIINKCNGAELFTNSDVEVLLDHIRIVFEDQSTIDQIVRKIMIHIQSILHIERCQILLLDENTETLNIPDVLQDDRFDPSVFAIICGLGIQHAQMYERTMKAIAKTKVTLEVLSYHAIAPLGEVQELLREYHIPSTKIYKLHDLKFEDSSLNDKEILKACIRMFMDLDLIQRFGIEYDILCRWLLIVRKNYRPMTYHNWRHAFNVAQMMFAILTVSKLGHVLGQLETLSLIIACLCHDLDHRGTNNSFQKKSSSPLSQLYSTSTMEHHHFDQCIMLLNSEGNQILSHLSSEEYKNVVRVLEEAILATDLDAYYKRQFTFTQMAKKGNCNWKKDDNRELLRAMLMTACDIGAITKPWEIQKKAFASISIKLGPLSEGVKENRTQWLKLAEEKRTLF
ncbi:dual 3',5'-cyclic-AMP and -GMP phosphodiesterase 11 [Caerostris darwini]|uniref:Phosphodiesterase n=1 Tax=Caerostris darwini TaxID=1538125 RepID=A0AAV4V1E8_9ARAC|nr:dual 3',5'-cyclic-AMP and -GMP phosphodiesterase 11 [Caerostris darwini]